MMEKMKLKIVANAPKRMIAFMIFPFFKIVFDH